VGASDLGASEPRGPCSASLPRWPLGGCRRDTGSRPDRWPPALPGPWLNRACPPLGTLWGIPRHRHARPVSGANHLSDGDRQRHPPGPAIGPAALPAWWAPATQLQRVGVWTVPWGIQRPWDWRHGTRSPAASTAAQFPPAAGSAPPDVIPVGGYSGRKPTCRQIGSFARAQERLRQGHSYPDRHGDGVACESLR
jgi:hypothetical protein